MSEEKQKQQTVKVYGEEYRITVRLAAMLVLTLWIAFYSLAFLGATNGLEQLKVLQWGDSVTLIIIALIVALK